MPTLSWINRAEALKQSSKAKYRVLELLPEQSYQGESTENLIIQGDNLEALKALLPFYSGKVRCIYIDPPFNTGQALENYDDNLEHSIWLSIMYPRLELLHELLSEDGAIFVHIDDNELGYLIVIMDEILGRNNRCGIVTFKQGAATGHKAINPGMVTTTNYVVYYAKNKTKWKPNRIFTERDRDTRYNQYIVNYEEPYQQWDTKPLSQIFSNKYGLTVTALKKKIGKEQYEKEINEFVINNANRVIRPARPDYKGVGEYVRNVIDLSKENPSKVFYLKRDGYSDMYFKGGERWLFYRDKLKDIDGELVSGEPLTNLWNDLLSNNLHNEGGVKFPKGKKPENLIKRVFELSTNPGDLILDSFLGSGTTVAVAHKMGLKYIGIEMGDHAITHCIPRLKLVVDGEQGGISKSVNWKGGGGFKFFKLGPSIFDEFGAINQNISYEILASHIWFSETKTPLPSPASFPLLGIFKETAIYLLYNGILSDKTVIGGNILCSSTLNLIPNYDGEKIIYGIGCRFKSGRLKSENITFKQIPYDVRAR